MKVAVYTSIFGGYDTLIENHLKLPGVDFICFTDSEIESTLWEIRKCTPIYKDSNRNAKKFKILPHRYLNDYDYSIWIDGNIRIVGNILELIGKHIYQVYDHSKTVLDPRNCIYKEYQAILQLGKFNGGKYKDHPYIMNQQIQKYINEGYPASNGLTSNGIILRAHNDKTIVKVMEDWWTEIKYGSRRDQLSYNYIAWKQKFEYNLLEGDIRRNKYFILTGKHKGSK